MDYNIGFWRLLRHLSQRSISNILTNSLWLVTPTPFSFFDCSCLYLAQLLLMVCRLQKSYRSPLWPWDQGLIKICLICVCFDKGASYFVLYNNCQYDIWVKGKDHSNLILVVLLVKQIYLTCFVVYGLYFAQCVPNMWIGKQWFLTVEVTIIWKFKVKLFKIKISKPSKWYYFLMCLWLCPCTVSGRPEACHNDGIINSLYVVIKCFLEGFRYFLIKYLYWSWWT